MQGDEQEALHAAGGSPPWKLSISALTQNLSPGKKAFISATYQLVMNLGETILDLAQ